MQWTYNSSNYKKQKQNYGNCVLVCFWQHTNVNTVVYKIEKKNNILWGNIFKYERKALVKHVWSMSLQLEYTLQTKWEFNTLYN